MKVSGILLASFLCLFYNAVSSQVNVKFVVKQRPPLHSSDSIFIAGNLNTWNPSDNRYVFIPGDPAASSFNVKLMPGSYEYKFTRGSWNKVETGKDGKDVANRTLSITKDTVVEVEINGWRDDFKSEVILRKHTALPQVNLLDSAFFIPQLNRTRRIWVYLPADYATTNKKFPVLYMHDGQNLFDEATSGFGEWGVDECLDSLFKKGKECIVIGIDNGTKRMNEYNPYEFKPYGNGEGDKYVEFLVNTLKPFIDKKFRTQSGKKSTFIAGSSMGGLISLYAVIKYPNVFGGAGIFSPAFWTAPGIDNDIDRLAKKINSKLFFYAGGKESDRMIPDMKKIEAKIKEISSSKIYERIDMEARHNESAWRKYFPEFYNTILN